MAKAAISGVARPAYGQRNRQNVVDGRDGEVLADAARRRCRGRVGIRDGREATAHQDHVRGPCARHRAPRPARSRHGPRPARRYHSDRRPPSERARPPRKSCATSAAFSLRQRLGDDLLDADAVGEGLHGAGGVSPDKRDHASARGLLSAATVSAAPSRKVSVKRNRTRGVRRPQLEEGRGHVGAPPRQPRPRAQGAPACRAKCLPRRIPAPRSRPRCGQGGRPRARRAPRQRLGQRVRGDASARASATPIASSGWLSRAHGFRRAAWSACRSCRRQPCRPPTSAPARCRP